MDHRDEARAYEPIFTWTGGWQRHYFDLPGMGLSPACDEIGNLDDMLNVLVGAIADHVGDRRFLLAGTSAGGYLARGVLARMRDRIDGLLLRAPLVVPWDARRDVDSIRPLIEDGDLLRTLSDGDRAAVGEALIQTPSYLQALRAKIADAVAPAAESADLAFLSRIRQDEERYRLTPDPDAEDILFDGPSLVMVGRHDASVGYRDAWRLAGKLPRSTYAVLDRAEHGLPIDQQDLFAALVRDWLARVKEWCAAQDRPSSAGAVPDPEAVSSAARSPC